MIWHPFPKDVFSDVDGDVLIVHITLANGDPLPYGIMFDPVKGIATDEKVLKPGSVYELEATATDPYGASVSDKFKITVLSKFQYYFMLGKRPFVKAVTAIRSYLRF